MNSEFIHFLTNKLQTGNLKSIHLNALPGNYATRLDIRQLDALKPKIIQTEETENVKSKTFAEEFLFDNLLTKTKFRFKINFDKIRKQKLDDSLQKRVNLIARKLNSIVNQNEDNYLEHGIKTFSFAYPFLIKRSKKDPSKIIKAPVIIWNLDIKRSNRKQNEWIIEQTEDAPININEVLISHIANEDSIIIDNLSQDFLEDKLIDKSEIVQVVNSLLKKLNSYQEIKDIELEVCPDKKAIEENTDENSRIIWSGIFGLFKTQKQSIVRDTVSLRNINLKNDYQFTYNEDFKTSNNSSVPTDPSQEEIINSLHEKEYKLIQGPPGTGKSQSLTAIITNMLENEKKILVVCEKKTALDVIYNNLKKLDLHKFVAIIDDVNRDRKKIIDRVRQVAESNPQDQLRFNEEMYDTRLKLFTKMVNDFNQKHHNLVKNIFLGYNIQDIVAEYIKLKKIEESDEQLLKDIDFKFSEEEYNSITLKVDKAVDLFDEIPKEALCYDILSKENFKNEYSIITENQIHELLVKDIEFLEQIKKEYFYLHNLKLLKLPGNFSFEYHQTEFDKFATNVKEVIKYWSNIEKETDKTKLYLDNVKHLNNNSLQEKINEISTLKENIDKYLENTTKIDKQLDAIKLQKDKLPSTIDTNNINFTRSNWFNAIFSENHKSIRQFQAFYKTSCEKIRDLINHNQLNGIDINLRTMIKRSIPIEEDLINLSETLKKCVNNQNWYQEYHNWRYFFDNLDETSQNCITLLRNNYKQQQWNNLFKLNYINLLIELKIRKGSNYNYNSKAIKKIGIMQDDLKKLHKYKISKIWNAKAETAIQTYNKKSNIKWLFNYRKNSKYAKKNTLRTIIHEEFDLFTDIFPVVLVNPIVCSSIFPLTPNLFDLVLFDEASQLRLEDTFSALIRAKIKVISGDTHQMPPTSYFSSDIALDAEVEEEDKSPSISYDKTHPLFLAESESLLDFANNLNPQKINTSFLDYHYRSRHPKLIDFSNAAFYKKRLIPMPEVTDYKPVHYINVKGTYNKNNTNYDEAKSIVDFLKNKYACNSPKKYPSLGIASFNMQQRNLIKDLINDECVADEEFREKMNKIGKQEEWFVKNLENIQGDERDTIIISTTFGLNAEGKFKQNFGQINTEKGYKLLNVLITRAKKEIYVFSSVPDEYISNYQDDIETKGNKGKAIFYAYIDYCRAIETDNEAQRQSILKLLSKNSEVNKPLTNINRPLSTFKTEIHDYLIKYISPDHVVRNYKLGGYTIDFVITNKEGKAIVAIECDGASRHKTKQAFSHDLHRKKIFEAQGLRFLHIWSKAWHPNPEKALEGMLVFIRKSFDYEDFIKPTQKD